MAQLLELENEIPRISEYEIGKREPDLIILLRYAKLARLPMEVFADDKLELRFPKGWKRLTHIRPLRHLH